jgi:hypothetical protein
MKLGGSFFLHLNQSLLSLLYTSRSITLSYAFRGAGRRHLQRVLHILVLCGAFDIVY